MTETTHNSEETRSPEEIEREIEETRAELGDTVAAVAEKTDVKKQAPAKVEETKAQARAKVEETREHVPSNPAPVGIAVAAVVTVAAIVLWRRR